jgi:hypothetical protein
MRPRRLALSLAAAALSSGCASVGCDPVTVVVASKDQHSELRGEPRGLRTDERERLRVIERQVIVTRYWVADTEGRWYHVPEDAWRLAEPGQSLHVCR